MAVLLTRSSRLCLFAGNEGVCIRALCAEFGALSSSAASSPSMSSPTNPKENAADMSARFPLHIGVSRRAPRMQGAKLPMMVCRKNRWQRNCQGNLKVLSTQFSARHRYISICNKILCRCGPCSKVSPKSLVNDDFNAYEDNVPATLFLDLTVAISVYFALFLVT